jgi:hypothetical protein
MFATISHHIVAACALAFAQIAAPGSFTPDQARTVFLDAGYQVDQLTNWDWLSPAVTTFQVRDTQRNRVLLVAVYPDTAQAQRWSRLPVFGYSSSIWLYNLAVFEADADDYQLATARASSLSQGMQADQRFPTPTNDPPATGVDEVYTSLLVYGPTVNV